MQQFEQGLTKLGLGFIPSAGNFITALLPEDGAVVYEKLLREGVIVRPLNGYGMVNTLRISIGLPDENQRCLDALARVLNS